MWKIGLTGSIGSGKSTVARLFGVLDIPVYQADKEAKRFYSYPGVLSEVIGHFGPHIVDDRGELDKRKLAEIVFRDADALNWLNQLIHPLVKGDFECWCGLHHGRPYVVHEAAILYESGLSHLFDRIIVVSAPAEISVKRIIERDQLTHSQINERMAGQWSNEAKCSLADFIIRNDGSEMLIPQVLEVHQKIMALL